MALKSCEEGRNARDREAKVEAGEHSAACDQSQRPLAVPGATATRRCHAHLSLTKKLLHRYLLQKLSRKYIWRVSPDDHVGYVLAQWHRELPELDRSAFAVIGRIARLALLLQAQLDLVFAAHGLSAGEFDVLSALRRAGRPHRLTPTELSSALIVTSGGMTRRLHALEDRGLVRRHPVPLDRRSATVGLSRSGKRLVEEVLSEHVRNEERLITGLTTAERDQLATLLQVLAVSLGDAPRLGRKTHRA